MMFLIPGISYNVLPAHQNSIHPSELSLDAGPSVMSLALCHPPSNFPFPVELIALLSMLL